MAVESPIQKVIDRASTRARGCHWRARGHELVYRRWRGAAAGLGVLSAALSATAGSALLSSAKAGGTWAIVAGVLGLLAAVLTASEHALGAKERMEENRKARGLFLGLRTDYRLIRDFPGEDSSVAQTKLREIEDRHSAIEMDAVPLEGWADAKVTREYDVAIAKAKAVSDRDEI